MKIAFELRFACAFAVENELESEPNGGKNTAQSNPKDQARPNPKEQADQNDQTRRTKPPKIENMHAIWARSSFLKGLQRGDGEKAF